KVGMFGSAMPRQTGSIPKGQNPDIDRLAVWYEVFGIDSIYDYDPVWEKCREVKIAPTFHSAGSNQALRNSPTNFTYNHLDHFGACKITKKQDWIDLYATPYYFGCEADDRMNATAFLKLNPFGAQLNAIYSSDIGHFDVIDMREPLPEAYELVEDGVLTEDNFRDFVFTNSVRLWGTQNPRFFEGTRVAKEATAVLQAAQQPAFQDAAK